MKQKRGALLSRSLKHLITSLANSTKVLLVWLGSMLKNYTDWVGQTRSGILESWFNGWKPSFHFTSSSFWNLFSDHTARKWLKWDFQNFDVAAKGEILMLNRFFFLCVAFSFSPSPFFFLYQVTFVTHFIFLSYGNVAVTGKFYLDPERIVSE